MEKSKKIKNSKKSCLIVLLVLFLAAGVGACYWFCFWQQAQAADETPEPVLEEGQEYTYAKITSILGNEMSYVIVEAKTVDFDAPQGQGSRRKERGGSVEEAGRSGVQKSSARTAVDKTQNTVIMTYTETDQTGQMQIPVGTEVETKLGAITTFSRLSSGDIVKMLLQTDDAGNKALMKLWIVE